MLISTFTSEFAFFLLARLYIIHVLYFFQVIDEDEEDEDEDEEDDDQSDNESDAGQLLASDLKL